MAHIGARRSTALLYERAPGTALLNASLAAPVLFLPSARVEYRQQLERNLTTGFTAVANSLSKLVSEAEQAGLLQPGQGPGVDGPLGGAAPP